MILTRTSTVRVGCGDTGGLPCTFPGCWGKTTSADCPVMLLRKRRLPERELRSSPGWSRPELTLFPPPSFAAETILSAFIDSVAFLSASPLLLRPLLAPHLCSNHPCRCSGISVDFRSQEFPPLYSYTSTHRSWSQWDSLRDWSTESSTMLAGLTSKQIHHMHSSGGRYITRRAANQTFYPGRESQRHAIVEHGRTCSRTVE